MVFERLSRSIDNYILSKEFLLTPAVRTNDNMEDGGVMRRARKRASASHPYRRREKNRPAAVINGNENQSVLGKITSYIVKPISWIFNASTHGGAFDKEKIEALEDNDEPVSLPENFRFNLPTKHKSSENVPKVPEMVPIPSLGLADSAERTLENPRDVIIKAIQSGKQITPEEFEYYTRIMKENLEPASQQVLS